MALETALAVVTANPARALGLASKGTLGVGQDADLLLIDPDTFAIERVMSGVGGHLSQVRPSVNAKPGTAAAMLFT